MVSEVIFAHVSQLQVGYASVMSSLQDTEGRPAPSWSSDTCQERGEEVMKDFLEVTLCQGPQEHLKRC